MTMTNALVHKGYAGSTEVSLEDGCLHGRVLFIDDLITYEADTVPELQAAFKDAVDRYLAHCELIGKSPAKPCSGTFNVRVGETLHRRAAVAAAVTGQSLNDFVTKAIEAALARDDPASADARIEIYRRRRVANLVVELTAGASSKKELAKMRSKKTVDR
jgi:predicted HicB family RNase H-like nuclease